MTNGMNCLAPATFGVVMAATAKQSTQSAKTAANRRPNEAFSSDGREFVGFLEFSVMPQIYPTRTHQMFYIDVTQRCGIGGV